MPRRNPNNCWTCRLRHKKCDGNRPACRVCVQLEISCHYSDTRPEWLDGGNRERAMAQLLQAEVKSSARQRRGQRALHRIQAELLDIPSTTESPAGDASSPQSSSHSPPSHRTATSSWPTSTQKTPPEDTASSEKTAQTQTPSLIPGASYFDLGLAAMYFDHIFPLLYPFYHPSLLEGGRAWVLAEMSENKALRFYVESLTSYILSLIPALPQVIPQACKQQALGNAQEQRDVAVGHLRDDLSQVINVTSPQDLLKRTEILNSMVHVLDMERILASGNEWQIHLDAALRLLDDILRNTDPYEVSGMASVLARISCMSPASAFPIWSVELAAFRFSVANLVVYDIIASISLGEPPVLLNHYNDLLCGDTDSSDMNNVQVSEINGCQDWATRVIGEIAAVDAWKKRQRRTGAPYVEALSHRAERLGRRLQEGLARLDHTREEEPREPITLDNITARPTPPISLLTRIWAYAAQVYLHMVLEGFRPSKVEIRRAVAHAIELLEELSLWALHLRAQALPLYMIGCMAADAERSRIRTLASSLGPLAGFGSIRSVMRVLENVWANQSVDIEFWDLAAYLRVGDHNVLLA